MQYSTCTVNDNIVPVFKNLTPEELAIVENNAVSVHYKKGETICKLGTLVPHILIIKQGLANAFIEGCSESLIIKLLPPGNTLGLSVLANEKAVFPYSSKAYVATEGLLVDIRVIREIMNNNALFCNDVIGLLSEDLHQIYGRFFCLTYKQLYGRLAEILLCLSEKIFKSTSFELFLSRKELGELAKMSSESVIRMLTKFKNDGLIDMEGKKITVKDFDRLRKISNVG